MPFGLKVPSKNTLIFSGVAGGIAGLVYSSNKYAQDARTRLSQRVSFLADRPCGVHEMPRKVTVYITAPPGDGLEKSRTWFREYVKPILVAGAVDYEIKEAKSPGQIETSVMEEIVQRRREAAAEAATIAESTDHEPLENKSNTGFTSPVENMNNKKKSEVVSDGILAIGRNAYREVLSGLAKGCDASLAVVVEEPALEEIKVEEESKTPENMKDPVIVEETLEMLEPMEVLDHFSLPPKFSPVMYIPHVNIIGWTNIPYRLYMWYADYKRIEEVGKYAVAAVLNQTRPFEERDADLGQDEKKYWIGHETAEVLKENDTPIQVDERIFDKLSTYTSDDLP
ncbi:inner membrane protein import complex subunit Tim54-domain-containing protein [Mucor mucedo]|uniref:inner membrane protein import complex subunit Tim54-domain-containing protein n=1 Tax=Mucor mucedo TaxID=29922 RepID=UPI00221F93BE|nr:inner membrane protein import complex subunit Tim54-domain-containing protein [Mucor mucedo]KAI7891446.1 inner membrane protein import complex subunit Tim54-domain-containing protein [Mucor mucedo]